MTATSQDRDQATRIWAAAKLRQALDLFLSAEHLTQPGIDQLCETLGEVADVLRAPPPHDRSLQLVSAREPDDRRGEETA